MIFPLPDAVEQKPDFSTLPPRFISTIEDFFGASVLSGDTVYGSFSASASFRILLSDGRRFFAKGNHPGEMAHGTQNLRQEIFAFENVSLLSSIAPACHGVLSDGDEDGWMLGFWDYVDAAPVLPSDPALLMTPLLQMKKTCPDNLPFYRDKNFISILLQDDKKWRRVASDPAARKGFCSLFSDPHAADLWLTQQADRLILLQAHELSAAHPLVLTHGDLRLDNILWTGERALYVDWPNACRAPLLFDPVFLLTHLEGMGISTFERMIALVPDASLWRQDMLSIMVHFAGYFATQAYRTVPEKMPRLRWMQKTMLASLLHILSRHDAILPPPLMAGQNP